MKEKFKEFVLKVKLVLMAVLILVAVVAGFVAEAWPKTKFNWAMVISVVSALLFGIILKTL